MKIINNVCAEARGKRQDLEELITMFPAQFKYDFAKLSHTWAFPAHFKTTALRKAYKHREAFSPAATGAETTMDVQRVRCQ